MFLGVQAHDERWNIDDLLADAVGGKGDSLAACKNIEKTSTNDFDQNPFEFRHIRGSGLDFQQEVSEYINCYHHLKSPVAVHV